ncbi:uncharacterized protein [Cardiocondyla obscurior]|uniref:uncharacterized protein n=1 Tax=Cardiocondyla obscurior TaxID=286306 RepID=UPI003965604A
MSNVAGRLFFFQQNWLTITKDAFILHVISGYKIPFYQSLPPRPYLQEPKLTDSGLKLYTKEIDWLLAKGAIQQAVASPNQFLSSYFLIDKKSGDKRFILNLKALNQFVFTPYFKMKDLNTARDSTSECNQNVEETLHLLNYLGFGIHLNKCNLNPSQKIKFLGFILDSSDMTISLPEEKRLSILNQLEKFSVKQSYANDNYDARMCLHSSLQPDFYWWLNKLQSPPITKSLLRLTFDYEIFSDASLTGWGASMDGKRVHGWWSTQEKEEHINFLELKAVEYALKFFVPNLRSINLLLKIDNTTAIAYVNKGGCSQFPKHSALAKSIWQWCEAREIDLFASYIKSSDNVIADAESRQISLDTEWEIASASFWEITNEFGSFDLDLFATHNNAKWMSIHPGKQFPWLQKNCQTSLLQKRLPRRSNRDSLNIAFDVNVTSVLKTHKIMVALLCRA